MKKYVFLTAIAIILSLSSCTADELESKGKPNNLQVDQKTVLLDDLAPPSEPVKTKGKDD